MSRVYSVLWGTLWLDYESEEAAKNSMAPLLISEVLGVSEWDGQGRANQYPNGFLMMTHTGGEYYLSTQTEDEREIWIRHIRCALECHFVNPAVSPYKPCKILQERPSAVNNVICPKTREPMTSISADAHRFPADKAGSNIRPENKEEARRRYLHRVRIGYEPSSPPYISPAGQVCSCCGRGYSAAEFVQIEGLPILQIGEEHCERMCQSCATAQMVILWMKTLNYTHVHTLHELTPEVQTDIHRFKNTFHLRRKLSNRLDMAAELYEEDNITYEEFQELRKVDEDYRREIMLEEAERLKTAVDALGADIQTIISLLLNPGSTDKGGHIAYHHIIVKLLEIADTDPQLVDFYWPQLLQVHLLLSADHTPQNISKVDELQQALIVLALKFPQLATKLAWSLVASIADYTEKRVTMVQLAACMSLLLQLEHIVTGSISSLSDAMPGCVLLGDLLQAADHQKQELSFEITVLFLTRRRLQESFDEEVKSRVKRTGSKSIHNEPPPPPESPVLSPKRTKSTDSGVGSMSPSAVELLGSLGVGPPPTRRKLPSTPDRRSMNEEDELVEHRANAPVDQWGGMGKQLDFAERLTTMVDDLRNIDRPLRTKTLIKELTEWSEEATVGGLGVPSFGWDPCNSAGEPMYRITRIIPELCRVFRTKARAPSMIVCEVVREDVYDILTGGTWDVDEENGDEEAQGGRSRQTSLTPLPVLNHGSSTKSISEAEVESEDEDSGVGSGQQRMNSNGSHNNAIAIASAMASAGQVAANFPHLSRSRTRTSSHDYAGAGLEKGGNNGGQKMSSAVGGLVDENISEVIDKIHSKQEEEETKSLSQDVIAEGANGGVVVGAVNSVEPQDKVAAVPEGPNSPARLLAESRSRAASSTNSAKFSKRMSSKGSKGNLLSENRKSGSQNFQRLLNSASSEDLHLANSVSGLTLQNPQLATSPRISITSPVAGVEVIADHNADLSDSASESDAAPSMNSSVAGSQAPSPSDSTGNLPNLMSMTTLTADSPITTESIEQQVASNVLSSARSLLVSGKIDNEEYRMLLLSDQQFQDAARQEEEEVAASKVESSFGESWQQTKQRVLSIWGPGAYMATGEGRSRSGSTALRSSFDTDNSTSPRNLGSSTGNGMSVTVTENTNAAIINENASEDMTLSDMPDIGENNHADASEWPPVDLRCFIVKSNDDLRQEMALMQLLCLCKEIFEDMGLEDQLFLKPYRIVSTSGTTGFVEVLCDTLSIDALKKTDDFTTLPQYFQTTYGSSAGRLMQAKKAFTASLAAYSIVSYILQIKDRHNGNVLIDTAGHVIHIDFGFMLGIAPGGAFSFETAPFKLTEEMVEVMDGLESPLFGEFVKAFTTGFLALRSNSENIIATLKLLAINSPFPCFINKDANSIIDKLRARFRHDLSVKDFVQHCLDLIVASYGAYGTRQYDNFQWYTNGIAI